MTSIEIGSVPVEELVARASEMPIPDEAEVARLVGRSGREHADARAQLAQAHLRIAVDEAIRNRGLGLRQEFLVRVASRALVDAAAHYAPEADGPFSAYARRVVRRAIRRELVS